MSLPIFLLNSREKATPLQPANNLLIFFYKERKSRQLCSEQWTKDAALASKVNNLLVRKVVEEGQIVGR